MCGRYTLTGADHRSLGDRFGASMPETGGLERFNVAPTEEVLTVATAKDGDGRAATLVRWGLVPGYAKDVKGPPMINARSETVCDKRPFSSLVVEPRRRCLVLADGFYEWMRSEDAKQPRQPFHFRLKESEPFAFAGLWCWAKIDDEWLASATILTCAPNALVARLHDRMPVILPGPDAEAAWLTGDLGPDDIRALCAPLDADRMVVAAANPRMNKAGIEEGPDMLRAPEGEAPAELTLFG